MLFTPTYRFHSVLDIDEEFLTREQIKGMILDLDNTLSMHGNASPEEGVLEWLAYMKRLGVRMIIASNNTRTRVRPLAKKLGLNFIHRSCKPITRAFGIARRHFGLQKREIVVIGDQLFTDILGANLAGMRSILVEPFHMEAGPLFKLKRKLEGLFLGEKGR